MSWDRLLAARAGASGGA